MKTVIAKEPHLNKYYVKRNQCTLLKQSKIKGRDTGRRPPNQSSINISRGKRKEQGWDAFVSSLLVAI